MSDPLAMFALPFSLGAPFLCVQAMILYQSLGEGACQWYADQHREEERLLEAGLEPLRWGNEDGGDVPEYRRLAPSPVAYCTDQHVYSVASGRPRRVARTELDLESELAARAEVIGYCLAIQTMRLRDKMAPNVRLTVSEDCTEILKNLEKLDPALYSHLGVVARFFPPQMQSKGLELIGGALARLIREYESGS